jgi:hypothetical protein
MFSVESGGLKGIICGFSDAKFYLAKRNFLELVDIILF